MVETTDDVTPPNSIHALTVEEWRSWLHANHTRTEGIWLIRWKPETGRPRVLYDQSVEEALCYGWIDSLTRTIDSERTILWFTVRRPGSVWSLVNKKRVERLIAEGRMTAAGQAKIDAAKRDGSWNALDAIDAMELPDDLAAAFAEYPDARRHYEAFPPSTKRAILTWVTSARTAPTRAKRIADAARLAQDNQRAR